MRKFQHVWATLFFSLHRQRLWAFNALEWYWITRKIIIFKFSADFTTWKSSADPFSTRKFNKKTFFIIFSYFSHPSEDLFDLCNLSHRLEEKFFIIFASFVSVRRKFEVVERLRSFLLETWKKMKKFLIWKNIVESHEVQNIHEKSSNWNEKFQRISVFSPFSFASFGLWCSPGFSFSP